LDHYELATQTGSKVSHCRDDGDAETSARPGRKSNEDDATGRLPIGVDKLAEVFVLGEQDAFTGSSKIEDHLIRSAAGEFGDGGYLVPIRTQGPHSREIAALIRQESHRLGAGPGAERDRLFP
jgi:hypothetical protein